jgi:hypothetical protein
VLISNSAQILNSVGGGREKNEHKTLVGKTEGMKHFQRYKNRINNKIKVNLKEIRCGGVNQCKCLGIRYNGGFVNSTIKHCVPQKKVIYAFT